MKILCPTCGKNPAIMHPIYGVTACRLCIDRGREEPKEVYHRRGLTDHERKKLSWYRDERKWVEDIRSRGVSKYQSSR